MPSFPSQAYQKGAVPKSRVLPVDGKVFTSEAEYSLLADRHFPDPTGELSTAFPRPFLPWGCAGWACSSQCERGFGPSYSPGSVWAHPSGSPLVSGGCQWKGALRAPLDTGQLVVE